MFSHTRTYQIMTFSQLTTPSFSIKLIYIMLPCHPFILHLLHLPIPLKYTFFYLLIYWLFHSTNIIKFLMLSIPRTPIAIHKWSLSNVLIFAFPYTCHTKTSHTYIELITSISTYNHLPAPTLKFLLFISTFIASPTFLPCVTLIQHTFCIYSFYLLHTQGI